MSEYSDISREGLEDMLEETTEEIETLRKHVRHLNKIKDCSIQLGEAVYNLFELLAKDHSIDIEKHEGMLRTAYNKLKSELEKS